MPTDTKRKPISEMIVFEEGVDVINDEHILLGTVTLTHRIKTDSTTLDHASAEEVRRMKAEAKRRIRNAIDDKLFGDARLALMLLQDCVERLTDLDAQGVTPGDPLRAAQIKNIDRLFAELKEELN